MKLHIHISYNSVAELSAMWRGHFGDHGSCRGGWDRAASPSKVAPVQAAMPVLRPSELHKQEDSQHW